MKKLCERIMKFQEPTYRTLLRCNPGMFWRAGVMSATPPALPKLKTEEDPPAPIGTGIPHGFPCFHHTGVRFGRPLLRHGIISVFSGVFCSPSTRTRSPLRSASPLKTITTLPDDPPSLPAVKKCPTLHFHRMTPRAAEASSFHHTTENWYLSKPE